MTVIQSTVRWADNTRELAANIKQGIDVVDAMRSAVNRAADSLGGQGLLAAANRTTAAIAELGGVQKLTTAEQERSLAVLDKAIDKYQRIGQTAPTAMKDLANSLRSEVAAADAADASHTKFHETVRLTIPMVQGLSARVTENIATLGVFGGVIGAAFAGLEVGKKAFEFGEQVAESAKALRALANETGVDVEQIQILSAATKDFGVDQESLARGIYQLSRRIAGDDQSAAAALRVLGLNITELKAKRPDEMFLEVMHAINAIPDPLTRSALAAELFGSRFAQALLAIGPDLDHLIEKVRNAGEFMSRDAVRGAAEFADAIDHLKLRVSALLGEALSPTLEIAAKIIDLFRSGDFKNAFLLYMAASSTSLTRAPNIPSPIAPMPSHGPSIAPMASHENTAAVIAQSEAMRNQLEGLRQAFPPLTAEQDKYLRSLAALGKEFLTDKNLLGTGITVQQLQAFKKSWEEQEAQAKKVQKAMELVAAASTSYGATLASIKPETAAEVQDLMRRGQWLDAMAPKYHLNEVQIKALAEQLKVQAAIAKLEQGATEGLASSHEHLGVVDNATIPLLKDRARQLEEQAKLLSELAKIESAMPGRVSAHLLPGDPINEIGRLKGEFKDVEEASKRTHAVWQELGADLDMLGSIGDTTFSHWIRAIRAAIPLLEQLITELLSAAAAAAALDFLKGVGTALAIGLAFASTGGVVTPTGVQHFDVGGMVLPVHPAPTGTDTVPAMLTPGEVVLNQPEQRVVGHLVRQGLSGDATGSANPSVVVQPHFHFHGYADRQALRAFSRQIAPDIAEAIAQNKRGADGRTAGSRARAALGLKS